MVPWNYSPGANPPGFPNRFGFQNWTLDFDPVSTSLFINLVDDFNDMTAFPGRPNDQVTGYTLANIEANMLRNCFALGTLSQQLKANRPAGVTEAQIDLLLSAY